MPSIVCQSNDLRITLANHFRTIPDYFLSKGLSRDEFATFITEAFDNLPSNAATELTELCFAYADTNTNGVLEPEELKKFMEEISEPAANNNNQYTNDNNNTNTVQEPISSNADVDLNTVYYETIMRNLGSDEVDMLRDAFIHMDMDSDGFVSLSEMLYVVRTVVGDEKYEALAEYLQPIFIVADKDRDGKLSLTEFLLSFAEGPGVVPTEVVNACVSSIRVRLTDEEIFALQERFRKIDTNNDGYIDPQELLVGLKEALGTKFPEPSDAIYAQILNVVMALADTDHDGKLSLSEFIRSFQEDQGVLPAVFIDTRAQNASRELTAPETQALLEAFASIGLDADGNLPEENAMAVLAEALTPFIADSAKVQELCELVVGASDRTEGGAVAIGAFMKSLDRTIPFEAAEERIAKVTDRLLELLPEAELESLTAAFSSLQPMGFLEAETLFGTVQSILGGALPNRGADDLAYIAQLIISTGEIDRQNTLNCCIDAFIATFRSVPEQITEPAPSAPAVESSEQAVVSSDAEVGAVAVLDQTPTAVAKNISRPATSTGYEGTPIRDDASCCPITDRQLRNEFNKYDVNGNGWLDREAFKQIYLGMEHFGVEPSQGEVNELFSRYSRGSDKITYEEFTVLMLHRSKM